MRWHLVGGRPVRSLVAGTGAPELVVVPGLGALGYLVPMVAACAVWTRVHLLDLPGFGARTTARLPADLPAVSAALGGWLDAVPDGPVDEAVQRAVPGLDPELLLHVLGVDRLAEALRRAQAVGRLRLSRWPDDQAGGKTCRPCDCHHPTKHWRDSRGLPSRPAGSRWVVRAGRPLRLHAIPARPTPWAAQARSTRSACGPRSLWRIP